MKAFSHWFRSHRVSLLTLALVAAPGWAGDKKAGNMNTNRRSAADVRVEKYDDGSPKTEVPFVNNQPEGLARAWWPNKNRHWESEYRGGKRHGQTRFWYENGQLESVRVYREGKKHGAFTDYYPNGTKAAEGEYRSDERVKIQEWNEAGKPLPPQSPVGK